jgi:hypothetical protein
MQATENERLASCDVISGETCISYVYYEHLVPRAMFTRNLDLCEGNDPANEV